MPLPFVFHPEEFETLTKKRVVINFHLTSINYHIGHIAISYIL